ncbi:DUF6376 family protein [Bacillus pseudomycoides]|uniref:DUF6376 family protein n=1 Tax=Bacillus pseudomycoides TaxID=64104 RepID=UPI000BEBE2F3|nr:DUF6376 family protein [Bacillus pseudomycoides]PEE39404.1 hypothetical protein COO02_18785 [Bacillus pseudomycoides]PGA90728.1 hypothetical protein COL91_12665 [Bacillus pseudomycoides]PHF50662.1 hypothetical protein COF72_03545 [Bacillus pseudomycoides]
MKAKKLVTLALPIMLLGGCGTDKVEKKADTKVEAKAKEKEKLPKVDYMSRMFALQNELNSKITEFGETAYQTKDKSNDINKLNKKLEKEIGEIQEIITRFDEVEPPKELEETHKKILKGADCYSKSFADILKRSKNGSITKESTEESKKLVLKGKEYLDEGFKTMDEEYKQTMKTNLENHKNASLPKDGKEFTGEWGSYVGDKYTKGTEFREDGTYTIFDDVNNTPYENTHMDGKWSYNTDTKQMTLTITEFVQDGKKAEPGQMKESTVYKVEYFANGVFKMVDNEGNRLHQVRHK